ncbi:MAG: type II secretion system protein GspF, partial [Alphaproteobacteria bacterium]|nr:type II secretion system protein GspF [Alphaproteobacteria bacterium]
MPEYDYLAIDPAGKERRGSLTADSADEARARLDQRKMFVVKIDAGKPKAARGKALFSFVRQRLSSKQLTLFTRQLSTLIEVSPLEEALRTISRQSEEEHVRAVVLRVHGGVTEGRRLADAMALD